jgi:hypothetical protein
MNAPLRSLADFLGIDLDLISVASEKSAKTHAVGLTNGDISRWVASLPPKEKDAVLMKLLRGDDPHKRWTFMGTFEPTHRRRAKS